MTATLSAVGSVSASRSVRSGRFYCNRLQCKGGVGSHTCMHRKLFPTFCKIECVCLYGGMSSSILSLSLSTLGITVSLLQMWMRSRECSWKKP